MRFLIATFLLVVVSCAGEDTNPPSRPATPSCTGTECQCVPDCTGRECGLDPVCGQSCGSCDTSCTAEGQCTEPLDCGTECTDNTTSACTCDRSDPCGWTQDGFCDVKCNLNYPDNHFDDREDCANAPKGELIWRLNGAVVAELDSVEISPASAGGVWIFVPEWGRNVQIWIEDAASTAPITVPNCAAFEDTGLIMSLITSDNSFAELDNLPEAWKTLNINSPGCQATDGDSVTTYSLDLTEVTGDHVTGSFEIEIQGAGDRARDTLNITGAFDTDL